jgi:hypothetical protein
MYLSGWDFGLKYQGVRYMSGCLAFSIGIGLLLMLVLFVHHRRPSLLGSFLFHFILFAWLGTYAAPYAGEGT